MGGGQQTAGESLQQTAGVGQQTAGCSRKQVGGSRQQEEEGTADIRWGLAADSRWRGSTIHNRLENQTVGGVIRQQVEGRRQLEG